MNEAEKDDLLRRAVEWIRDKVDREPVYPPQDGIGLAIVRDYDAAQPKWEPCGIGPTSEGRWRRTDKTDWFVRKRDGRLWMTEMGLCLGLERRGLVSDFNHEDHQYRKL